MEELKKFLVGFITIILGVVLIAEIGDRVYENTQYSSETITNETWTLNSTGEATTFWVTDGNYTLSKTNVREITVYNSNGTALTLDTDYGVDNTNIDSVRLDILNGAGTTAVGQELSDHPYSNQTFITYNRYPDNYIQGSSAGRMLVGLTTLFFAIGIVCVGIWVCWKSLSDLF